MQNIWLHTMACRCRVNPSVSQAFRHKLSEEKLQIKCGKGQIYRINKRVVANYVIISYVTSNY